MPVVALVRELCAYSNHGRKEDQEVGLRAVMQRMAVSRSWLAPSV